MPPPGPPPGGRTLGDPALPPIARPVPAPAATAVPAPSGRRRGLIIGAAAVVVVLLAGGGVAAFLLTRSHTGVATITTPKPTTTSAPTAPEKSAVPTPAGVAYSDPEHYYTAQFDGAPAYHSTQQSTPVGSVPYMYAEYVAPHADQLVGVLVFDPGTSFDPQKGLQGIATEGHGTVISSMASTFQGNPSIEGVISLPDEFLKVQLVHVGSVAYIIGTAGTDNPPSDYQRFISAVHITPH